jgi:hypothetical protein
VGRDAELDQLHTALERAAAGHGQVMALVGEPGVGKSRADPNILCPRHVPQHPQNRVLSAWTRAQLRVGQVSEELVSHHSVKGLIAKQEELSSIHTLVVSVSAFNVAGKADAIALAGQSRAIAQNRRQLGPLGTS